MRIFLIAPYKIDRDFDNKKSIIDNIFRKNGIELILAVDSKTKQSLSAQATIEEFNKSDYFIVDLSFERPSCYYEMGYLQALKKQMFVIAKENETIHQLLNRDDVKYFKDLNEYKSIIENIVLTIKK